MIGTTISIPMLVRESALHNETPDIESSSPSYDRRFSGPTGKWFLALQTQCLFTVLGNKQATTILDVGGGHGQAAIPLIEHGHKVTVLGSAPECARKLESEIANGQCEFHVGKLLELPYNNTSFDTVVSFRILSHVERWPEFIAEMCRVAADSVIIDYPVLFSFNALFPLLFAAKRKLEGNSTRHYLLFSRKRINEEFRKNGFVEVSYVRQYFFPMVLHRVLNNVRVSKFIEKFAGLFGLRFLLGSPIVARFSRVET